MKIKPMLLGLAIVAGAISCKNEKPASPNEVLNPESKSAAQTLAILRSVTESVSEATQLSMGEGGSSCQSLTNVSSPVRGGSTAFKHTVSRCGERAELEIRPAASKYGTYAYGWSVYIPSSWENNVSNGKSDIITQIIPLNTQRDFAAYGCGGAGSKIAIKTNNSVIFDFARKGSTQDIVCNPIQIYSNVSSMKGRWTDFVMRVKWTGNSDGFIKIYVKNADGTWSLPVNQTGPTYWNDEQYGPYFKMGLYKGDPNWNFGSNNPRVLYTDEYRMGDSNASFQDVSPGDSGSKTW